MRWLLVRFIISAIVMAVITSGILPGVRIIGNVTTTWVAISVIFALINLTIKPVLRFLTCPFIVLSLGLVGVLINVLMLYLTVWGSTALIPVTGGQLQIDTFVNGFVAALIITVTTILLEWLFGSRTRSTRVEKVTEVRYVIEKQRPDLDAQFNRVIQQNMPPGYTAQQRPPQAPYQQPYPPTPQVPQYPPQTPPGYGQPYPQNPQYPPQAPQVPPGYSQPTPQNPQNPPPQAPQYPPGSFGTQNPPRPGTPDDWDFEDPRFPRQK
ncbi:MAG: phage holin family protein [bacterium]|nr:phage holin family protein [bacterium]